MPVSDILAALADENRRRILSKLKEGRIASGALAQAVGMTPQALSYHLKKLREAELIYETRHKNFIYYELDLTVLDEAILWLNELRGGYTPPQFCFWHWNWCWCWRPCPSFRTASRPIITPRER